MSCPSCDIKALAEWMFKIQTKLDMVNERTKSHTLDIKKLRKEVENDSKI